MMTENPYALLEQLKRHISTLEGAFTDLCASVEVALDAIDFSDRPSVEEMLRTSLAKAKKFL